MPTLRIPTPLRPYTGGQAEIALECTNVAGALSQLTALYPDLKKHLFNDQDELRTYVNLFLNDEDVRHLQGLETPLNPGDRLMIIPSIAGG